MILRRVTQHVREQNWTAIGIDFVIVVVGVFIGIQVSNWNEARKDARDQEALLDRLAVDFRELEPVIEELVAFSRTTYQSTASVIEALRSDTAPSDEAAFRFALARANAAQSVPQIAPTYAELVNSGALSDIEDIALRGALTRYGDAHGRLERLYPAATTVILDPNSIYLKAVDWNMDPATWTGSLLFVDMDHRGLWRLPLGGGDAVRIDSTLDLRDWGNWVVTDRGILLIDRTGGGARLVRVDPATGARAVVREDLRFVPSRAPALAATPDARRVVLARIDRIESAIVLSEPYGN